MKRIIPFLLIICMLISISVPAFAAETDESLGISSENTEQSEPDAVPENLQGIQPLSGFEDGGNEFFTRIRLTVTDRSGNPIEGAVYGLYTSDETFVEYLTTDTYGIATSSDVPVNTDYYIEESSTPTGYLPNTERKNILLTEVCAPSRVDMTAVYDPIMGRIMVIKTNESGNPLSDVGFYVYNPTTGELVDTIQTGKDGTAITKKLPYGWYELYEYLTPEGYNGGGYYMAMVEHDGETAEVYITN